MCYQVCYQAQTTLILHSSGIVHIPLSPIITPRAQAIGRLSNSLRVSPAMQQVFRGRFNESQLDAIQQIISLKKVCTQIKRIANILQGIELLQGPPGTGKTSTILGVLSVLVSNEVRTLVCSPSNHAVDEIARKVVTEGLIGVDGRPVFPNGLCGCAELLTFESCIGRDRGKCTP